MTARTKPKLCTWGNARGGKVVSPAGVCRGLIAVPTTGALWCMRGKGWPGRKQAPLSIGLLTRGSSVGRQLWEKREPCWLSEQWQSKPSRGAACYPLSWQKAPNATARSWLGRGMWGCRWTQLLLGVKSMWPLREQTVCTVRNTCPLASPFTSGKTKLPPRMCSAALVMTIGQWLIHQQ